MYAIYFHYECLASQVEGDGEGEILVAVQLIPVIGGKSPGKEMTPIAPVKLSYVHDYSSFFHTPYIHTYIYPSGSSPIKVYIHTYIHIYIHIYIYIHTYILITMYGSQEVFKLGPLFRVWDLYKGSFLP